MVTMMSATPHAAEPVKLYAAGSLRAALTEVSDAFAAASGNKVDGKYAASGTLKNEIAGGARADLLASANMEHPRALSEAGKSGPVVLFARNRLCALVRPDLIVTPASLLTQMLDPGIKLASSTPGADPSGDYAWEVFRKAESLVAGAQARLQQKALQLVGAPTSPTAPPGQSIYGTLVAQGKADIFLTYCTNAAQALRLHPGQQMVALPNELAVGADYGLTVIAGASPAAYAFALFILSVEGQRVLARHGFAAPTLPQ
ncbi:MAG: molybdate ABC transporter substrate-binding protein [Hyphomicrobiales bacterium]|nr:molybdate ABC transporter substrate-binding protein [Hyphomicrobiales bacterium]